MSTKPPLRVAGLVAVSAFAVACSFSQKNKSPTSSSPTGPSGNNAVSSLLGTWRGADIGPLPNASSCGGGTWTVTSQQSNSIAGTFHASCPGGVVIDGAANGIIDGNTISSWGATGMATGGGLGTCPVALGGTGSLVNGSITLDYSGNACGFPVHGTETLTRH